MNRYRRVQNFGAALFDQALSGVTNLLVVVVVARQLSTEAFGSFSIAYACFVLVLGVSRAYLGIPLALSTNSDVVTRRKTLGASLATVAILAPVIIVSIGFVLPWIAGPAAREHRILFLAVGVASVLACAQDATRYFSIAAGRARDAIASDTVWFLGILILLGVIVVDTTISDVQLMTWWVLAIAASAITGILLAKPKFACSQLQTTLVPRRGARESAALVAIVSTSGTLLLSLLVSVAFSVGDAGSLRGANTLLAPINLILSTFDLYILGRLKTRTPSQRRRIELRVLAALACVLGVWSAVLLLLPAWLGQTLLGETWAGTRSILPWLLGEAAIAMSCAVASLELKVRDSGQAMIIARIVSTIITFGLAFLFVIHNVQFNFLPSALVVGAGAALVILVVSTSRRSDISK